MIMENDKKLNNESVENANGGVVLSVASGEFDRCPLCDNPTPVVDGWCKCTNCGHSWPAGSH